jgi:ABC-type oligopeptide transport system ATPase subunit
MTATLLRAEGLHRAYPLGGGRTLRAVDGIDLELEQGKTLAIVGESGCGKSTLGRLLLRLEEADAGRILLDGTDMRGLRGDALRAMRQRVQVVFQDPYGSLNPRERIRDVLVRPMLLHKLCNAPEANRRAAALMERVGLSPAQLDRLPHEFSGGQRQRIAIARALSVRGRISSSATSLSPLWMFPCRRRWSTCCRICSGRAAWRWSSSRTTWRWCGISPTMWR